MLETVPTIREFPEPDETITSKILEKLPGITSIHEEIRRKAARFLTVHEQEKFTLNTKGHRFFLLKESTDPALNKLYREAIQTDNIHSHFDVIDLHSHTNHIDGVLSPEELVENAITNGITKLAVTEHNATKAARDAKHYAEKHYPDQIEIILGVELATTHGHLIIYCSDEEVLKRVEEEFPILIYMNEHTAELENDYNSFYEKLMREGPHAHNVDEALKKLQKIREEFKADKYRSIKTSTAHPFAGSSRVAKWCNDRGLTSAGGFMTHPDFDESILSQIDLFEVHNDCSSAGYPFDCNRAARKYATRMKMVNLTTGSDTHIADPQALTLVQKGTNLFDELQTGRTIFIRRQPNELDIHHFDNVRIFPWFIDNYMSEVPTINTPANPINKKWKISDSLFSIVFSQARIKYLRDLQSKIRKSIFRREHHKWEKARHHSSLQRKLNKVPIKLGQS